MIEVDESLPQFVAPRIERPEVREELYRLIDLERAYQDNKWGQVEHTHAEWVTIALEELGEMARCVVSRDPVNLVRETVHAVAVLVAFLEWYVGLPDHVRIYQAHWRKESDEG